MNLTKVRTIMMFLISFLIAGCGTVEQGVIRPIDADELKELNVDGIILLDVRTPGEFESGRIKGAVLINYRDENFKKMVSDLDTKNSIIVYCAAGGRSTGASKILMDLGFKTIYNYTGGFNDWKNRGEEIEYQK